MHKLTCLPSFQHPHSHPYFASFTGFQKFSEILPHFSQQLLFISFQPVRSRQAGGKETKEGNEGRKRRKGEGRKEGREGGRKEGREGGRKEIYHIFGIML